MLGARVAVPQAISSGRGLTLNRGNPRRENLPQAVDPLSAARNALLSPSSVSILAGASRDANCIN